jgi:hypothetical protein
MGRADGMFVILPLLLHRERAPAPELWRAWSTP